MKLANGATIIGLHPMMRPALIVADEIYKAHGQELTITCGLNGEHSAGSLHYYGQAVDLRIRDFKPTEVNQVVKEIKKKLGVDYDVVEEIAHIHLEYDPKTLRSKTYALLSVLASKLGVK